MPFVVLVLVGASNAVNLTDGLDGLAIGATLIAAGTYAVFTYVAGNAVVAHYLQVAYVPGRRRGGGLLRRAGRREPRLPLVQRHPAEVFMGDVGSLAIGGAIGTVAVLAKQEVLLVAGRRPLRARGALGDRAGRVLQADRQARVLRMAPLHHHFELAGWPEPKIIVRFWILAILFALLSLSTLKLR